MKKKIIFLSVLIVLILCFIFRHQILDIWQGWTKEPVPESVSRKEIMNSNANAGVNAGENLNISTNESAPEEIVLPKEFNLKVPFTTQSPFAEWTEQDNESCEEAAILTVHYYWQDKIFTKQIAKEELQKIVDFEINYFGFFKDTNTEQTADLARKMWGYQKVEVIWNPTIEDIKKEVYQGRPVILPTAGRKLGNPNFKSPGPIYHMLVVRGWNEKNIITNDPGTRKGENYQYSPDVLYKAIHDWNNGDIDNGKKAMIVIYPNEQ